MKKTLVMLLAGGGGTRLNILSTARAKPAVPFGGLYRIIDFALSNVMNSGIDRVAVLTQYKPLSLNEHVGGGEAWDLYGRRRGAKILPPRTGDAESDWYRGTADAIRQNLDYIDFINPERIMILSGDHIYHMDYGPMIEFHKEADADLTIAMMRVPWEDTRHFGIASTDDLGRIVDWEEKPTEPKSNLASLGIYCFDAKYLTNALRGIAEHDFGKNIIPAALANDTVFAYPFEGYWRDVGTLQAYWAANMDMLDPASGLDIRNWRVRTNHELDGRVGDRPPSLAARSADAKTCVVSPGCHIEGRVERSVLSPGVTIEEGADVQGSVLMHNVHVGRGAVLRDVIVDKNGVIGDGARIGTGDASHVNEASPDHLYTGLTVIGKGARIPAGADLGRNTIVEPHAIDSDFGDARISPGSTVRRSS
ncbi:MAG: glucose-1-phosphate adenylyltransferase [Gemmatimonadetes bacterium]|nr:glucose-1-phosphate adenylyltransferase [Gemmatimonadota bacterium]